LLRGLDSEIADLPVRRFCPIALVARMSKAICGASWFETAQARLLTMRVLRSGRAYGPHPAFADVSLYGLANRGSRNEPACDPAHYVATSEISHASIFSHEASGMASEFGVIILEVLHKGNRSAASPSP
jgi:hypothetical protein